MPGIFLPAGLIPLLQLFCHGINDSHQATENQGKCPGAGMLYRMKDGKIAFS